MIIAAANYQDSLAANLARQMEQKLALKDGPRAGMQISFANRIRQGSVSGIAAAEQFVMPFLLRFARRGVPQCVITASRRPVLNGTSPHNVIRTRRCHTTPFSEL